MNNFYVGQKVVCIKRNEAPDADEVTAPRPFVNSVYTVRWVGESGFSDVVGKVPAIRLEEIVRTFIGRRRTLGLDWPYAAEHFRPVEPKALEIFRRIAADPKRELEVV